MDVANTASINEDREEYANFSVAYLPYEAIIFTGRNNNEKFGSLKDFVEKGNKVAIVREYDYGKEAMEILYDEKYKQHVEVTNSAELSARMVAAGRVDGTIGNRYTLSHTAKESGVRDKIRATNTVVQSTPVHFMFSKKSVPQKVIHAYNQAIEKLKADGTIQAIVDKYTGQTGS